MLTRFQWCRSDEDYARFALYYIRNRHLFNEQFTLMDTLCHILQSIQHSQIMLILREDELIGWGHYGYVDEDEQPAPEGPILFMHSIIVDPLHRSHGVFLRGFRELIGHVAEEAPQIREFRFFAERDHVYLNRLYGKFARIVGQREGAYSEENIYATGFDELKRYLRLA